MTFSDSTGIFPHCIERKSVRTRKKERYLGLGRLGFCHGRWAVQHDSSRARSRAASGISRAGWRRCSVHPRSSREAHANADCGLLQLTGRSRLEPTSSQKPISSRGYCAVSLDLPYNDQSNLTRAQRAPERQAGAVWHHPRQGFEEDDWEARCRFGGTKRDVCLPRLGPRS